MNAQIYKDASGEWRWRIRAANGKTIADSGEGYLNHSDCRHGLALVTQSWDTLTIETAVPS